LVEGTGEKGRKTSNLRWNTDYPDCRFSLIFSFYRSKSWNLLQIRRGPLPSMSSTVHYSLSSYHSKSRNLSYRQRHEIMTNRNTSKLLGRKAVSRADMRPRDSWIQAEILSAQATPMGRQYSNVFTSVKVWKGLNFLHRTVQYRLFQINNLMNNSFIFQQYVCYTTCEEHSVTYILLKNKRIVH